MRQYVICHPRLLARAAKLHFHDLPSPGRAINKRPLGLWSVRTPMVPSRAAAGRVMSSMERPPDLVPSMIGRTRLRDVVDRSKAE